MELGLSLGDGGTSKSFGFMEKSHPHGHEVINGSNKGLGFCMGLSIGPIVVRNDANDDDHHQRQEEEEEEEEKQTTTLTPNTNTTAATDQAKKAADPLKGIQLIDLLPNTPVAVRRNPTPSFLTLPWTYDNGSSEAASACSSRQMAKGFDVNKLPLVEEPPELELELGGAASSPKSNNSAASSFQVDFCIYSNSASEGNNNKRDFEIDGETERASSRASDEDENGSTRKKLRLSKEQSAFLEESFKEHNTLNPKQKLGLAKQLNLRPRQVEVWFQNRRARTKLKQTEVDCEYLKRCCETLTEENKRLQKDLQELRALKTSNNPFYMQLPATTLTMCPSCERVATTTNPPPATTTTATASSSDPAASKASTGFSLLGTTTRPKFFPFSHKIQSHAQ